MNHIICMVYLTLISSLTLVTWLTQLSIPHWMSDFC